MIEVKKYTVGVISTNCYIIKDVETDKMAIVDPGDSCEELDIEIEKNKDNIEYILLTHGHYDHIMLAKKYRDITGAKIVISLEDKDFTNDNVLNLSKYVIRRTKQQSIDNFVSDLFVSDGDIIKLGNTEIKVLATPGHTRGGVCYIVDNFIFSGDTIMKDTVGRTDFLTGDSNQMRESCKKIASLANDYFIYPGHGENTTLYRELKENIYLRDTNDENLY